MTNQYMGGDTSLACAGETAADIDEMVVELVKREYAKAEKLLSDNMPKLHELAKFLYREGNDYRRGVYADIECTGRRNGGRLEVIGYFTSEASCKTTHVHDTIEWRR